MPKYVVSFFLTQTFMIYLIRYCRFSKRNVVGLLCVISDLKSSTLIVYCKLKHGRNSLSPPLSLPLSPALSYMILYIDGPLRANLVNFRLDLHLILIRAERLTPQSVLAVSLTPLQIGQPSLTIMSPESGVCSKLQHPLMVLLAVWSNAI